MPEKVRRPGDWEVKVGDTVTIRTWDDMWKQFNVDAPYDPEDEGDDAIRCRAAFVKDMREYCGRSFEVRGVSESSDGQRFQLKGADSYVFTIDMIESPNSTPIVPSESSHSSEPSAPRPTLTLEWIESTGGWPDDTGIAVVNDDGSGFFGKYLNGKPGSSGGWIGTGHIEGDGMAWTRISDYNYGKNGPIVLFASMKWKQSIVYNPAYAKEREAQ